MSPESVTFLPAAPTRDPSQLARLKPCSHVFQTATYKYASNKKSAFLMYEFRLDLFVFMHVCSVRATLFNVGRLRKVHKHTQAYRLTANAKKTLCAFSRQLATQATNVRIPPSRRRHATYLVHHTQTRDENNYTPETKEQMAFDSLSFKSTGSAVSAPPHSLLYPSVKNAPTNKEPQKTSKTHRPAPVPSLTKQRSTPHKTEQKTRAPTKQNNTHKL